jgi:hypothetical protein
MATKGIFAEIPINIPNEKRTLWITGAFPVADGYTGVIIGLPELCLNNIIFRKGEDGKYHANMKNKCISTDTGAWLASKPRRCTVGPARPVMDFSDEKSSKFDLEDLEEANTIAYQCSIGK